LIIAVAYGLFPEGNIVNLPALLPEPSHKWPVKFGEVRGVGNKEDFAGHLNAPCVKILVRFKDREAVDLLCKFTVGTA
jgi:hypothetical protein